MTPQPDPGYAQLVRSIFKALQRPATTSETAAWDPGDATDEGAPYIVGEERPVARVVHTRAWGPETALPKVDGLTRAQRDKLAAAWLADALDEHAAIAGFARFTLHLLALGAPPELLRGAQRAGLDVVTHAELCFGLAGAYAGRPLGAGALDTQGEAATGGLSAALADAVRDGCVGDTIHAMVVTVAAERCEDEAVTRVLRRIAADEVRHAGLAWRFVRWATQDDDALRASVRDAFDDALALRPPPSGSSRDGWMARHGRLPASERNTIAAECAAAVIRPCVDALLHDDRPTSQDASRQLHS